jgi:hypothetical protein
MDIFGVTSAIEGLPKEEWPPLDLSLIPSLAGLEYLEPRGFTSPTEVSRLDNLQDVDL